VLFTSTRIPQIPKDDSFYDVTQWRDSVGLRVPESAMERVSCTHNEKYFKHWSQLLNDSPFKRYYRYIAATYEPKFAKYDYSLIKGFAANEESVHQAARIATNTAAVYCRVADACAMLGRAPARSGAYIKRRLRSQFP